MLHTFCNNVLTFSVKFIHIMFHTFYWLVIIYKDNAEHSSLIIISMSMGNHRCKKAAKSPSSNTFKWAEGFLDKPLKKLTKKNISWLGWYSDTIFAQPVMPIWEHFLVHTWSFVVNHYFAKTRKQTKHKGK